YAASLASSPLLSFHRSVTDRDLLSVPTRRSSDLTGERGEIRLGLVGPAGLEQQQADQEACFEALTLQSGGSGQTLGQGEVVARADRKSTRLNSSHGSISYAVFCLKKKKSKQTRTG